MSTVRIPTSNKPKLFVCEICSKRFTRKDYLYRHQKNHSQIKPYKCDQCNLRFARSDLLSKHFNSKSHQKINDMLNERFTVIKASSQKRDLDILYKESTHIAQKDKFQNMGTVTNSILNHDIFSEEQLSDEKANDKEKIDSHERLGISNFLNPHSKDEKIPAPPPQPSIILPGISQESNRSDPYVETKAKLLSAAGIHDSQQKNAIYSNGHPQNQLFASHDTRKSPNNNNFIGISGAAPDIPNSIVDKNLSWLFNDNLPLDNLLWLFTDSSPQETEEVFNRNEDSTLKANDSKIPLGGFSKTSAGSSSINYNDLDIAPMMYQNLYNESTNSKITNSKINMTGETRSRILNLFSTVEPLNNISLDRFEEYLDLYWFNFAQTFPLIHQATFDPNTISIYLLISMIVIGMAHSLDKVEYETSIIINKKFRGIIYGVIKDNTEISLPLMQALMLHNFSAKNFGDTQLCKLAQIDHGSNIMYMKFSGFLSNLTEPTVFKGKDTTIMDLRNQWHEWIYYESCKRTVFFEFICDTQHVTFSKIRSFSSFDVKFELPCSDEVWNSADPVKFYEEYQKQPKGLASSTRFDFIDQVSHGNSYKSNKFDKTNEKTPSFSNDTNFRDELTPYNINNHEPSNDRMLSQYKYNSNTNCEELDLKNINHSFKVHTTTASHFSSKTVGKWPTFLWSLKSMMTTYKATGQEYSLECYSLFSRYIILHGLSRICWNMRGQSFLDLGFISSRKLTEYFTKLEKAFLNWKGYFDLHVKLYELQVGANRNMNKDGMNRDLILSLNNYGPTNASWANISYYYTGLFCLYADIPSITFFATEYRNFHSSSEALYKGVKEMEYERNKLIIEKWAKSIYGNLALIEACKFLRLVYENEETINTFSHIPSTIYLTALIVWCYEVKREFPNIESSVSIDNRKNMENGKIELDARKYFDLLGNINYNLAKADAHQYFSNILNSDIKTLNENGTYSKVTSFEVFRERQSQTIGVVCYVLHLLRHCKWLYSIDLVHQLEHVIMTYEKF